MRLLILAVPSYTEQGMWLSLSWSLIPGEGFRRSVPALLSATEKSAQGGWEEVSATRRERGQNAVVLNEQLKYVMVRSCVCAPPPPCRLRAPLARAQCSTQSPPTGAPSQHYGKMNGHCLASASSYPHCGTMNSL